MAKEITVNTDSLKSTIDEAQGYLDAITKNLDRVYDSVAVIDGMWDGPANDAFNAQFQNDKMEVINICNTVQEIINCLTFAKDQYNTCDGAVSSVVSAIQV